MRMVLSLAVSLAAIVAWAAAPALGQEQGVALAIIYDTSGSMKDPAGYKAKDATPKYVIANRALTGIAKKIETFAAMSKRTVHAGLFTFQAGKGREAIPFGPFNAATYETFARTFAKPEGNTPLGNTLSAAWDRVMESPLPRKHILVITDGENTAGPTPAAVYPKLQERAKARQAVVAVHFVAFDVDAKVFDSIKAYGATVVGAANEAQLNTRLQQILQEKILLEDEEQK